MDLHIFANARRHLAQKLHGAPPVAPSAFHNPSAVSVPTIPDNSHLLPPSHTSYLLALADVHEPPLHLSLSYFDIFSARPYMQSFLWPMASLTADWHWQIIAKLWANLQTCPLTPQATLYTVHHYQPSVMLCSSLLTLTISGNHCSLSIFAPLLILDMSCKQYYCYLSEIFQIFLAMHLSTLTKRLLKNKVH
jgi:hypothetical protein